MYAYAEVQKHNASLEGYPAPVQQELKGACGEMQCACDVPGFLMGKMSSETLLPLEIIVCITLHHNPPYHYLPPDAAGEKVQRQNVRCHGKLCFEQICSPLIMRFPIFIFWQYLLQCFTEPSTIISKLCLGPEVQDQFCSAHGATFNFNRKRTTS